VPDSAPPTGLARAGGEITLERLTKRYADTAAVEDVSLTIRPGEFMTLLGPSGSGKTTTLNAIAGFVTPTSGRLLIDGVAVDNVPPHRRDIGMVFQHYALFPHMTVAENIAFPLKQRKVARGRRAELVDAALATVRLPGFERRYPHELSGGQQQRVAVARSIVYAPRVLLMDEPLGALDKKLRDWLQLEIKRIHDELGTTFVYVTHDQDEALVLSDRVAVFNHGRIQQVGTPGELYERPSTLFVAQFLGDSTVLRGQVSRNGSGGSSTLGKCGRILRAPGSLDGTGSVDGAIVVRPERLAVHANGGGPDGTDWNTLPAVVEREIYLGSSRKLELRLPDGDPALVREQAGRLADVRAGDQVTLAWRVADSVLLTDDPDVEAALT
jgi:putative spermidine/putrescine transport system ATP-binding protein